MSEPSTEEEILEAAGTVLAERGYDGFTTQAIADEAGVSQGLVHHYFGTKQELLVRLFEWGSEDVAAEVDRRIDADDPREELLAIADYMLNAEGHFEEALDVARISLELRHRAVHDDDLRELFERERSALPGLVADIVQRGVDQGVFREVDPDAVAEVFLGAIEAGEQRRAILAEPGACDPMLEGLRELVDALLVSQHPERSASDQQSTGHE